MCFWTSTGKCKWNHHVEFEVDRSNRFSALSDDDDDADDEESNEEGDLYSPSLSSEEERGPRTSNAPADVDPFNLAAPPFAPRVVPDVTPKVIV